MISRFKILALNLVPYALDRYGPGNLVASTTDLDGKSIVI
jgi:hypothetical protein